MKKILTGITVFALFFGVFSYSVPQAEAACSYNGYINSKGKCAKSFKDKDDDRREYRTVYYDYQYDSLQRYIELLLDLIKRLEEQRDNLDRDRSDVDVITRSATNIDDDAATLRGELDLNDEDEAEVYFEYGTSRYDLDEKSDSLTRDENDDEDFSIRIDDLDDNRLYYFRAVAEDEDGDEDYGSILSFRTDDSDNDQEPELDTRSATDITDDSAELRGEVDMNDFDNGRVFFVYGESKGQVEDIEDDYDTYSEIDEDGDDLQKILIDPDLDGSEDYTQQVFSLDNSTDIYFSICVQYENEDNDDTIKCGSVEDFETDN